MRLVTYADRHFEGVDRLWRTCFPDNPPRNHAARSIPAKLAMSDDLLIVAEDKSGAVVGSVMAGYDGHRGWLYSVAVLPEMRRTGLGAKLVEEACSRLRRLGCIKVNLQIVSSNHAVEAFYAKLGFQTEPRISMGREL